MTKIDRNFSSEIESEDQYESRAREVFSTYLRVELSWEDFRFLRTEKHQRPDYNLELGDVQIGIEVTSIWDEVADKRVSGNQVPSKATTQKIAAILTSVEDQLNAKGLLTRSHIVSVEMPWALEKGQQRQLAEVISRKVACAESGLSAEIDLVPEFEWNIDVDPLPLIEAQHRLYHAEYFSIGDRAAPDLVWGAVNRAIKKKEKKYENLEELKRPVLLLYDMTKWSEIASYQEFPEWIKEHNYFPDIFVIWYQTVIPLRTRRIIPRP